MEKYLKSGRKYRSIRIKTVILGIILSLAISISFGLAIFNFGSNLYLSIFRENKLALTQTIADSIDGDYHSKLTDESMIKDPEYLRYFKYLQNVRITEQHITWLYTVNYDKGTGKFTYAVDSERTKSDYVWIESEYLSLYFYLNDQKEIVLVYNDEEYFGSAVIQDNTNRIFKVTTDNKSVLINNEIIATIVNSSPLEIKVREYVLKNDITAIPVPLKWNLFNENIEFTISFVNKGDPISYPGNPFIETEETLNIMKEIIQNGKNFIDPKPIATPFGDIICSYAPIRNSIGENIGLVMIDTNIRQLNEAKKSILKTILTISLMIMFLVLTTAILIMNSILRPLRNLTSTVTTVSKGNLDTEVNIKRNDEIGLLADRFNGMIHNIRDAQNLLISTNQAYFRFVPQEFLTLLKKDEIIKVQRGDFVQKEICILFSDIRSFTTLSETMTPGENFNFINDYLGIAGPKIRLHNGFIDKYIGDGIMALFPDDADNAIDAAIALFEGLKHFNKNIRDPELPEIKIGVGIHSGDVMLGIIGEENRMDGTVISDAVNLSARVETLTKDYTSLILITEDVLKKLKNPGKYCYRFMEAVQVKGKSIEVKVFEIILPDFNKTEKLKAETLSDYNNAIKYFYDKDYNQASTFFQKVLAKNQGDTISLKYTESIKKLI